MFKGVLCNFAKLGHTPMWHVTHIKKDLCVSHKYFKPHVLHFGTVITSLLKRGSGDTLGKTIVSFGSGLLPDVTASGYLRFTISVCESESKNWIDPTLSKSDQK